MKKRFLVIGSWTDKKSGKPLSGVAEITSGVGKDGNSYEFANTDRRESPIEGSFPVGTIVNADMNFDIPYAESKKFNDGAKVNS